MRGRMRIGPVRYEDFQESGSSLVNRWDKLLKCEASPVVD